MENKKLKNVLAILYIAISICSFIIILLIPTTKTWFSSISLSHPFLMGFIKFALLATAGELLASFIAKAPSFPVKLFWRFIIWGLIGVWITFMMKVYSFASASLIESGILPGKNSTFLKALYTSVMMNTSFGPTFMAVHKCTDKMLELFDKKEKVTLKNIVTQIDWHTFVSFTIIKTIPLFWIPMHTLTFLLPAQYQVMVAAMLSVALGVFLSFGNRKKQTTGESKNGN